MIALPVSRLDLLPASVNRMKWRLCSSTNKCSYLGFGILPSTWRRAGLLSVAVLFLVLNACATFPEQKKISQFANATAAMATVLSNVYTNHVLLVKILNEEESAHSYVVGGKFDFPPEKVAGIIPDKLWIQRLATINAIGAYAHELAKISTPGSAKNIAASGSTLVTSIVKLAELASGTKIELAKAFPNIAGTAIQVGVNQLFARRIHETIYKTDPYIQEVADLLANDISTLKILPEIDIDSIQTIRSNILRHIRLDRKISKAQRYDRYLQMVRKQEQNRLLMAVYSHAGPLLAKFSKAHSLLLSSIDEERRFDDFIATANSLAVSFQLILND